MNILKSLCIFFLIGLVASCAKQAPEPPFSAVDLSGKLAQGFRQRVDNVLIIQDATSSMYDQENGRQKVAQAKNVILHMIATLPPLKMQAGLEVFGPTGGPKSDDSNLIYGMSDYDPAALAAKVRGVQMGGLTPLAKPLLKSADDLKESKGTIAVIMVSDGIDIYGKSPVEAAQTLKNIYGDRICFYTILIGKSPEGKKVMEDIAAAGKCGFATTEEAVATSTGMADFVEGVFLEKEPSASAMPAPTSAPTLTMNLNVQFDFDQDEVRPDEQDNLKEFADFLKAHPQATALLEGHTDNSGAESYNRRLSLRRAENVKKYLVKKFGIDPARLTTRGYGCTRPLATNKTDEGRQENRRVVAVISEPR